MTHQPTDQTNSHAREVAGKMLRDAAPTASLMLVVLDEDTRISSHEICASPLALVIGLHSIINALCQNGEIPAGDVEEFRKFQSWLLETTGLSAEPSAALQPNLH